MMIGNHISFTNIEKEKSLNTNIESNINQLITDTSNNRKYINSGIIIEECIKDCKSNSSHGQPY